jgi:PAS domain S-box-containing protein
VNEIASAEAVGVAASPRRALARQAAEIAAVAFLYFLSGKLGRTVAPPPGIATVFWPPSGIALAALLILGNRVWPGVWLGAFLENNWAAVDVTSFRSIASFLAVGIGIDTGSLLQALAGAALVRRYIGFRTISDRLNHTVSFISIAMGMCLIGCTFGVVSLWLGGALPTSELLGRWWTWWIGDACGVLVIAPLILTWWRSPYPDWSPAQWIEAALLYAGVIQFTTAIFVLWQPAGQSRYPADLLILPMVAWVAYRFTQREMTLVVATVLGIALWGTIHGSGPYRGSSPWSTLPVLQAFIGILSILSITICAVITERKDAGEALQTSERWLRECQRISRIGSYVFDIRSDSWTGSESLDEIFGIGPNYQRNIEGWGALIHPEDRQRFLDHVKNEVIGEGKEFSREFRIVRPGGGVRWVLGQGAVSRDVRGVPVRIAGTVLDITERRNIEAELIQAQKMESIGRLAGGVAHDFNNLLTVINGYGDLVLSQLPTYDESYRYVKEMCRAGERAADLTMQLLAFSRKQILQPRVLSLNDIVRDSDKMLRRLIGEHIDLVCVLEPGLKPVEADPGQLHQVIVNLAVNARDAMPDGGQLTIETANGLPQGAESQTGLRGDYVCLTVRDTGLGMDKGTMERAFEPFFTTKGVGKGTGLGLSTVYGIVRQSAGHISIESEPGQGAAFHMLLPAVQGAPAVEAPPAPVVQGSETVLLVEDEDSVRRFLVTILRNHGYQVLQAAGGEEAIRTCRESAGRIDLLITDVVMPRMRGPELAARLRAMSSDLRVLYISGYTDPPIGETTDFGAGSHYLQKPFAQDALLEAVREALNAG